MNHIPNLVRDLGLILIVAGITTLLFKKIKQPVVLGYILAGVLVSPHFPLFPTISDIGSVRIWAEIGVIILLFNLGLEFSFKKLMRVGGSATITAFIEISAMLGAGFVLGKLLGWPTMDCLFLGGILSIASTTIILRSFEELGLKNKKFAELVLGVLIIEDLIAVVLLVLLSTIAVTRQFAGKEMLLSVFNLMFFLSIWFTAGIFFIPSFLSKAQKHLNNETILVVSLGLCLMMVLLAAKSGFSPALGAFMMGSILAETTQAERIEKIIAPLKDLFGAIFFVSVGMLIEPGILVQHALPIIVITLALLFFKTTHVTIGALISGKPLETALQTGMSMAQIGEFSFIIAALGMDLKVTSGFLYPIAVAVSAITTFSTPYMIKMAPAAYRSLSGVLPNSWKKSLTHYSTGTQTIKTASNWNIVLSAFVTTVFFLSVINLGIIVVFATYVTPWMETNIPGATGRLLSALICLLILSPFLWALSLRKIKPVETAKLWNNKRYRPMLITLRLLRTGLAILYFSVYLLSTFSWVVAGLGILAVVTLAIVFSGRIHRLYIKIEEQFFANFYNRETEQAKSDRKELAPWDAHIVQYVLPAGSVFAAKTLKELAMREQLGINVAMIKRGDGYTIAAPQRHEQLYPGDTLYLLGTEAEIEKFKSCADVINHNNTVDTDKKVVLAKVEITDGNPFIGHTIRQSGIREQTNGLVAGIERNSRRILNPESDMIISLGDLIWLVGDEDLIKRFTSHYQVKEKA